MDLTLSVSRVGIRVSIAAKGEAEGAVFKHLAPATVNQLLNVLPTQGRAIKQSANFLYIPTNLALGVEKARTSFKRGEIALFPANGGIYFFLADSNLSRPMNPLGKITAGVDVLDRIEHGDTMLISAS